MGFGGGYGSGFSGGVAVEERMVEGLVLKQV
jgi:hypothetical protein